MTETGTALDDHAFLSALLDIVIPPGESGEPPGAGSMGLERSVAAALQADPMLGPLVEAGARAVREAALARHPEGLPRMSADEGRQVVEEQLASHPFLIMGLSRYLYPEYYQQPRVLEAIGEPPRPPFPEGFDVEPTDARLLEKLEARRKG